MTKHLTLAAIVCIALTAAFVSCKKKEDKPVEPPTPAFVAVTDITGVPTTATAGTALTLTGTVAPTGATNKTITWAVKTAGTTGATISSNSLNTSAAGTVVVTATVANGATATTPYTKDFTITVNAVAEPPETAITVENEEALVQAVFADEEPAAVSFATDGAWTSSISEGTAKAEVSWMSITPDHGDEAGEYTVTINVEPNASGADREATITITCNGDDINIAVTQKSTTANGEPYIPPTTKTVSVGAQVGTLTAGTAGTVTFPVTTSNLQNGSYGGIMVDNFPFGMRIVGDITINNNAATLTFESAASAIAGTYSTLTLTIEYSTFEPPVTSAAFTLTILEAAAESPYFDGSGTSADPYLINSAEELEQLAELVNDGDIAYNSKYYKLTVDIDLSNYGDEWNDGKGWIPVGRTFGTIYSNYTRPFMGHFDGNYHKVSGLYINDGSGMGLGLFGSIEEGGSVKNLGVEGEVSGYSGVGGVVGSLFNNCSVTNCYSTVMATGNSTIGGIAGGIGNSCSITNCYATGRCNANGAVSSSINAGGIAGSVSYDCKVINCYATGAISGYNLVGGIAGTASYVGEVGSCVALNPSLSRTAGANTKIGRIAGDFGTYYSNAAWVGMTVIGAQVTGSAINGVDITNEEAKTQATYENLLWKFGSNDDNPWKMGVGTYELPVFYWQTTAPAAMPAHLE